MYQNKFSTWFFPVSLKRSENVLIGRNVDPIDACLCQFETFEVSNFANITGASNLINSHNEDISWTSSPPSFVWNLFPLQ